MEVIILGGGCAGLAAALFVQARGGRAILLEAAKSAGGRVRSFPDPTFGQWLDNGPHLLIGAYRETLALLNRLGTPASLLDTGEIRYGWWRPEIGHYDLFCPALPSPLHLLAGVGRFPPLSWSDRLAAMRLGISLAMKSPKTGATVAEWLHANGQGPTVCRLLWEPFCLAALNLPIQQADAALFANVLYQAFIKDNRSARPIFPRQPLSQMLVDPAIAAIRAGGGEVHTSCRVIGLATDGDRVCGIRANCGSWSVRGPVIAALTPPAMAALMPDWASSAPWAGLLQQPIVSVYLRYHASARLPGPMVGLPDQAGKWLFDIASLQQMPEDTACFAASISGATREIRLSPSELIREIQGDLGRILPELVGKTPTASRVIKSHRATLAVTPEAETKRPGPITPWRNLFLAGDWTDTGMPATIEGAVRSAKNAVNLVWKTPQQRFL